MAAPVVPVSDALFTTKPVATDKVGNAYTDIQKTRKGIVERFVLEHEMADAEASSGNQGKHIVGSARAYVADTPTVTPEAPVYSGADGYAKGRLNVRPTAGIMDYHNGTDWAALQYVGKAGNETVAGVKTFSSLPKTEISTAFAAAANEDILPKKTLGDYITAQINAAIAAATLAAIPVGFIYVQLPGKSAPATLYPGSSWSDVSSDFAGLFFRAAGGGASAFGSGVQTQQIAHHNHNHTHKLYEKTDDGISGYGLTNDTTPERTGEEEVADVYTKGPIDNIIYELPASTDAGDENRPANVTVKIWQRTA